MFARGQSSQRNKVRASHNQLGGIHTGSNNFLWTDCKEMKPGLFTSPIVILAGETCKTPPLHFLLLSQILGAGKAKAWQAVATMALPTGNCRFFLVTRQRCGNHTPSVNGADTCLPASLPANVKSCAKTKTITDASKITGDLGATSHRLPSVHDVTAS